MALMVLPFFLSPDSEFQETISEQFTTFICEIKTSRLNSQNYNYQHDIAYIIYIQVESYGLKTLQVSNLQNVGHGSSWLIFREKSCWGGNGTKFNASFLQKEVCSLKLRKEMAMYVSKTYEVENDISSVNFYNPT